MATILANPFFSAGIGTIILMIIVYVCVGGMDQTVFWRSAALVYVTLTVLLFLNNRQLIRSIRGAYEEPTMQFTDIDPAILEASAKYRAYESGGLPDAEVGGAHEATERTERPIPAAAPDVIESSVANLYPINWLSA